MPEALLVLFGLADRWPASPAARADVVIEEIVQLRRLGFRFIALADDNFYPVTLTDLELADAQNNTSSTERAESAPSGAV